MISEQRELESKENNVENLSNGIEEDHWKSTISRKETLFVANCSTIREQQESCSSFISKNAFDELVNHKNANEPSPFV